MEEKRLLRQRASDAAGSGRQGSLANSSGHARGSSDGSGTIQGAVRLMLNAATQALGARVGLTPKRADGDAGSSASGNATADASQTGDATAARRGRGAASSRERKAELGSMEEQEALVRRQEQLHDLGKLQDEFETSLAHAVEAWKASSEPYSVEDGGDWKLQETATGMDDSDRDGSVPTDASLLEDEVDWERLMALVATSDIAARRNRLLAGNDAEEVRRHESWAQGAFGGEYGSGSGASKRSYYDGRAASAATQRAQRVVGKHEFASQVRASIDTLEQNVVG